MVSYTLEGNLGRLRIAPPREPRRADWLWEHTCCEIFIGCKDLPAYHEFNLAPSGEWAAYAFTGYRNGVPLADEELDPRIAVRRAAGQLEIEARIRLDRLGYDGNLAIGHHREAFALQLDEARH